ncbi:MAG: hypothetical protein QOG20_1142 [Pseudonocardiales bacterium]|nr:hypothetical protein [Pseudonocardiales bacterium]
MVELDDGGRVLRAAPQPPAHDAAADVAQVVVQYSDVGVERADPRDHRFDPCDVQTGQNKELGMFHVAS